MLAETTGCTGVGVDPDEAELELARLRARGDGRLSWMNDEIADCGLGREFDAAICVGATHAFGSPGEGLLRTLERMHEFVKPGGRLLVGEGYWRQEPPQEYLHVTPFEGHHLADHASNEALGARTGWVLIHSEVSSLEEWDEFESSFLREAEARSAGVPEDEDARAELVHWRSWNEAYQRWGRDTLGFGFYVFELRDRPDAVA